MKISACWIVKNEEAALAASIESVRAAADELVVVDTGSTDLTAEIAVRCGARVEQAEWREDFSAARNYALGKAGGDYVIFIDADEFFFPALREEDNLKLQRYFERTRAQVLQTPRIELDITAGRIMGVEPHSRVLKRGEVLYKNRVHELPVQYDGSVPRVFLVREYRLMHTGYSSGQGNRKFLRNIELLEAEQPELKDAAAIFNNKSYLLREYLAIGNYEKAFENCLYLMAHPEVYRHMRDTYSHGFLQLLFVAISLAGARRGWFNTRQVKNMLFGAIKRYYPHTREAAMADLLYRLMFDYREDRFLEELGAYDRAQQALPPTLLPESRRAEAAIYGKAALAAHGRGDTRRAAYYASHNSG